MCSLCVALALGRVFSSQRGISGGACSWPVLGVKGERKKNVKSGKLQITTKEQVVQIFVEYENGGK